MGGLTKFLGDSPLRVAIKLVVISFLVGVVMHYFGWAPMDIYYAARNVVLDFWNMGFSALERFAGYILIGAAVVVPVFVVLRLLSYRR